MSDLFLLNSKQVIDLFEIKLNDLDGYFRFHGSKNFNRDLVFKGNTYLYIPSEISNVQYDSDGKQNRPTFSISNANNFISDLLIGRNSLLGRRFSKKKLLAKDLDAVNFGGDSQKNPIGQSNFRDFIQVDTYTIHKKNFQNKEKVEFELANILDIDGLTCPKRKVFNNSCQWTYRGAGCNYGKLASYDGPTIALMNFKFDTLQDVLSFEDFTADNLGDYVSLWLTDPKINGSFSGREHFRIRTRFPDEERLEVGTTAAFSVLSDWSNSAGTVNTGNTGIIINDNNITLEGKPKLYNEINVLNTKYLKPKQGGGSSPVKGTWMYNERSVQLNTKTPAVLFNGGGSPQRYTSIANIDTLKIVKDYSDTDKTIFYVGGLSGMFDRSGFPGNNNNLNEINSRLNAVIRSSAASGSDPGDFVFGFDDDGNNGTGRSGLRAKTGAKVYSINGEQIYSPTQSGSADFEKARIFCITLPKGSNKEVSLYEDGKNLFIDSGGSKTIANTGFKNLFINEQPADINDPLREKASNCFLSEIIIFEKILSEKQILAINSYLAKKHGLSISPDAGNVNDVFKNTLARSKSFFADEEGNLGVPVADSDDKSFLKTYRDASSNNSYGLESMNFRGDYDSNTVYVKGDFVKLDIEINFDFEDDLNKQNNAIPSRFFVYVADSDSKGIHPLSNSEVWIEDKCSKKLSGCGLRFRNESLDQANVNNVKIPFGGFPGTVTYDYKLPD